MLDSLLNKAAILQAFNFIITETLTHVFSRKYCKIFRNIYFEGHLPTGAFESAI